MPGRRQLLPLTAVVVWSICWLVLGSTPASGYQRETRAAADAVSERLAAAGKKSVAVVDFTDLQGEATELGRFLAEEISVALASGDRPVEVVDRTHLKVLVQENKLSATGLIDPATARKLGQIAGVDAIVTGTLTPFGDTVRLTLKVLDTSTARIVAATTAEIPKTKAIEELVARGVGGVGSSPARTQAGSATPPGKAPTQKQEGGSFSTELKECRISGTTVRCQFLTVNSDAEKRLSFYASNSRLLDEEGNEYNGKSAGFGGRNQGDFVSASVATGVPMKLQLVFEGVPPELRRATLLAVPFNQGAIQFRDVTLVRE